ncbi:MAG: LCP family protein [Firmicutes bacterium]|jgi:LCP family protein required for cell wall assembly|nr:LCP family protein [Bacillota bacterium]
MTAKKWTRAVSIIILIMALLLVSISFFYCHDLFSRFQSMGRVFAGQEITTASLLGAHDTKPTTILLYGIDAGEFAEDTYRDRPGNADTIILIRACPVSGKAALLSISRDTLVEIPGSAREDRIGHAHAQGGAGLLVDTVKNFTGVPIDGHIGLNYISFKGIVDFLGGVEFDVDREMEERGITLYPGKQVLDGDQAFALISFRKGEGDIGRVRRQQRFMEAVFKTVRQKPIDDIFYLTASMWQKVETDLGLTEFIGLQQQFSGITEEDIRMAAIPGTSIYRGGTNYLQPDEAVAARLIEEMFPSPVEEGAASR